MTVGDIIETTDTIETIEPIETIERRIIQIRITVQLFDVNIFPPKLCQ